MNITLKSPSEIATLRECGKRLAQVRAALVAAAVPGVSTGELDRVARAKIAELECVPVLSGYRPYGAKRAYPASICVSIDNEVVHGIPSDDRILEEGQVVTLDVTIAYRKLICDSAVTVIIGGKARTKEDSKLIEATRVALDKGIAAARAGATTGDIGHAIDSYIVKQGFRTIRALAGHGVGYAVHEDPYVPNQGEQGYGDELVPGMVIAIEPIVAVSTEHVDLLRDGYTYVTHDGSMSAHFEHTVVITEKGPEVLTR
jgi:methionyl aminopeptidase